MVYQPKMLASKTMKKEIKPTNEKALTKKYDLQESKKILLDIAIPEGDLNQNLKRLGENILPKYIDGSEQDRNEAHEALKKMTLELLMALELETHVALMEAFEPRYRGLAKELSSQLIKDYNCQTSAEKALAETIANAYIRVLDNSRRLNNELECKNITHERNKYISNLSNQVDRANRQFLNSLLTLKQLKAPTIEMNIKTKNTFLAQNQNVNVDKKENHEIIDAE